MFTGIPEAALDFFDDLELDNTKSFWTAHKHVYDDAVKAPLEALLTELAPEFGKAKMFRPYRDVRFSKDKTTYKTHQGAEVPYDSGSGWYLQVSAAGVFTGAGCWGIGAESLARFRAAVDEVIPGEQLRSILADLEEHGFEVGGEKLKTTPRGYDADHPRIELLRHKWLTVHKNYGFEPYIHTPELLDQVRSDWRHARPLVEWLAKYL